VPFVQRYCTQFLCAYVNERLQHTSGLLHYNVFQIYLLYKNRSVSEYIVTKIRLC